MGPFEQQLEMMDIVFTQYPPSFLFTLIMTDGGRMIEQCRRKCIPKSYHDPELLKGEAVCSRRCGAKLLSAVELISNELAQLQKPQPK